MDGVLDIDTARWETPFTDLPDQTVGNARLATAHERGYYHMEGVRGFAFYRAKNWLTVRTLQRRDGRRWKTWMIDNPLHWHGMREWVMALPPGKLLVGGLGMGLMLHHLMDRPDITHITVVELDPDVVRLIGPTLPPDPRRVIVNADYYRFIAEVEPGTYDAVLWDLAVGDKDETGSDMLHGEILTSVRLPGVPLYMFGARRHGELRMDRQWTIDTGKLDIALTGARRG